MRMTVSACLLSAVLPASPAYAKTQAGAAVAKPAVEHSLAHEAAEEGVSLNRLASVKLSRQ